MKRFLSMTLLSVCVLPSVTFAAPVIRSVGGDNTAASIAATVAAFQGDLGDPLNGGTPGPLATGRRQINWDAAPVPFDMPGDFFNGPAAPFARGVVFTTGAGSEFRVSNDGVDNRFDTFNPSYATAFSPFSTERLFTPLGTNVMEVKFFVPGSPTPATVSGFGAVFTDVDLADSTMIEFFGTDDSLLYSGFVSAGTVSDGSLSFLGVSFTQERLASVRITVGNTLLGADDDPANGFDVVVMDDFLYSEPQANVPEPLTASLCTLGMAGLLTHTRRRSNRGR